MKKLLHIVLFSVSFMPSALAQMDTLKLGFIENRPFIKVEEGRPSGVLFNFWLDLANKQNLYLDLHQFYNYDSAIFALEAGEIATMINPISVDPDRSKLLDYSTPVYVSDLVAITKKDSLFVRFWKIFSLSNFIMALIPLVALIFTVGMVMWLLEYRRNPHEFRRGIRGLGDGMWWSAVTITTVGYGDTTPKSIAGRWVAVFWMLLSITAVSGFTASIASSLTVERLNSPVEQINDLKKGTTYVLKESYSDHSLTKHNIEVMRVNTIEEGIAMVEMNDRNYFVHDRILIDKHFRHNRIPTSVIVSNKGIRYVFYCFPYRVNSPWRNRIEPDLISYLNRVDWLDNNSLLENY